MAQVLFTNVQVLDGSGAAPFAGQVWVTGQRIRAIAPADTPLPAPDAQVVDGRGATLMPGLIESHCHLTFTDITAGPDLGVIPTEEHLLAAAGYARVMLQQGFTSCFSAASAKPRLDIVLRRAIDSGTLPGPRMLAASPELTVTGGLGDVRLPQMYRESYALIADGPQELRRLTRELCREGVDIVKINPSGDGSLPHARADQTVMNDAEVAAVCEEALARGKRVAAHARSAESIKLSLRHGVEIIYHANFADEEACELLQQARARVFVAPTLGMALATMEHGPKWGRACSEADRAGLQKEIDATVANMRELHRRGVRVLPGGDYGFAWNPIGSNARDLQHFVEHLAFTPMEAIVSATRMGGEIMGRANELGQIKPGFLADLLLVDGDPLADVSMLQDRSRLRAVMLDGEFFKQPT